MTHYAPTTLFKTGFPSYQGVSASRRPPEPEMSSDPRKPKKSDESKKPDDESKLPPPIGHYMPPPPGWTFPPPVPYPAGFIPPPAPHMQPSFVPYVDATGKPPPPWHQPNFRPPPPPPASVAPIKISINQPKLAGAKYGEPLKVSPTQTPSQTSTAWPPSLKAYVERCFATCKNDGERDKMEALLKERVQKSIAENALNSTNWGLEPILSLVKPKPMKFTPVPKAALSFNVKPSFPKTTEQASMFAMSPEEARKKAERAERFTEVPKKKPKAKPRPSDLSQASEVIDWDEFTIVGTMAQLEKPYLRLTSAPDPSTVRPLAVLQKTLEFLKARWLQGRDYGYICDQFKSLRQDLTVQRIKNDFTVKVYEIHARIALEKADLGEYNQCQSMLVQLYEAGLKGSEEEFIAYRVLYYLSTKNRSEMNKLMAALTRSQHEHPAIKHALQVRSALSLGNYHSLFKLYKAVPNMGSYLMDTFIQRERVQAMAVMCKAYRPTLKLSFLQETLTFDSHDDVKAFLVGAGVACDTVSIDTKASVACFE